MNLQDGVDLLAAGVEVMIAVMNAEERGARAGVMNEGETKDGQVVEERRALWE